MCHIKYEPLSVYFGKWVVVGKSLSETSAAKTVEEKEMYQKNSSELLFNASVDLEISIYKKVTDLYVDDWHETNPTSALTELFF